MLLLLFIMLFMNKLNLKLCDLISWFLALVSNQFYKTFLHNIHGYIMK